MMKIKPFEKKLWLASPTMHGKELKYMQEAYETMVQFFSLLLIC